MKQYRYHICVPNENSVEVKKYSPDSKDRDESSGIFRQNKITDQIREAFQNPGTLKNEQVQKVGEALFETLFDDQLNNDFFSFYQKIVIHQDQTLEVVLEINETAMPEMVAYPWEFMCLPERYNRGDIHLATHPKLNFFRTRYNLEEEYKPSIEVEQGKKLKIALAVARPTDDSQLSNVEYQPIHDYLTKIASQPQNKIEFLSVISPVTAKKVSDQLRKDKPDIFHFIGHGQLRKENGKEIGEIAFVKDSGEADWKEADFFSILFLQHRPKIVILQACETGSQSESNAFSSVAYRLMLQGIPVVIAMQYKVSNQTAISFAKDFYEEIINGNSVDLAVQQARYNIVLDRGYKQRDFAIPVIYMNASDGYLFLDKSDGNQPKPGEGDREELKDKQYNQVSVIQPSFSDSKKKSQQKIEDLTEHFESVTEAIEDGELVLFLGPGINLCGRPNEHKYQNPSAWDAGGQYPPTRSELAVFLEKKLFGGKALTGVQCPLWESEKDELPEGCPIVNHNVLTRLLFQHVSQLGESEDQREDHLKKDVEKALNAISTNRYDPSKFHNFCAQLPETLRLKGYPTPKLIVTANFDSTLERAFQKHKQEFDLVFYVGNTQNNDLKHKGFVHKKCRKGDRGTIVSQGETFIDSPNKYLGLDPENYPVILKLYGPVEGTSDQGENFVITEDHFIDYLAQSHISHLLPANLLDVLHNNHILFLGYGLSHWDERVVLRRIWSQEQHPIKLQKCWAIQSQPTVLDLQLWKQAGVTPRCTSLEDYITELKQRVNNLQVR